MSGPPAGFPGGLRLPGHKRASAAAALRSAGLPEHLVYPLQQHIGTPSVPVVRVGERVLKGQRIARAGSRVGMALNAASSGTVIAIDAHPIAHPGAVRVPSIVIEVDGADAWGIKDPPLEWQHADPGEVVARIESAGIVGMGGAGFPAHVKLREGIGRTVEVLVINGVECEPFISCDDRLLRDRAGEVVAGARILAHAARARRCVVAIKDDMRAAGAAVAAVAPAGMEIVEVPGVYPAGGEKQLIGIVTGRELPATDLPIQAGVLMYNVATAAAVYRAVCLGEPLLSRLVTVSGEVAEPGNFDTRIGTPVAQLLAHAGQRACATRIVMGGPMMGVAVHDLRAPVTKTTNCILALRCAPEPAAAACIRCGRCAEVCPVRLQPQELYASARAGDLDGAQDLHLFDCIECGCCAYVCPSQIPLVHYYRHAKSEIDALDEAIERGGDARRRCEAHAARAAVARGGPEPAEDPAGRRAYVQAAVLRVQARRRRDGGGERH